MLAHSGYSAYLSQDELDSIHNYYEKHVIEAIFEASERARGGDRNFMADVACVALNRLPPRYIRHDVDMTFFMSPQELEEIRNKVTTAVHEAILYVTEREELAEAPEDSPPPPKPAKAAKKPKAKNKTKASKKKTSD